MVKFGIALPNFGKYADSHSISTVARAAERLGYGSVWVSEHIVVPKGHRGFGTVFYEPLTTLAYVAASTSTVSLGTSVLVLPLRNPLVLAKSLSTLDQISGGRLILGVGAGWLEEEFRALGVPFGKRGAVTDEYIEVLKALFASAEPEFEGDYFRFGGVVFDPIPIQKPRPPILVGGGSAAAIRRAARYGDGWHPVGMAPEELGERVALLDEELGRAGRTREGFEVVLRKNLQIGDMPDEDAEPLRGPADKVVEGILAYEAAGVTHFVFQVLSGTFEGFIETMEGFMTDVRPGLG